jgi:hypothetical protein
MGAIGKFGELVARHLKEGGFQLHIMTLVQE